MSIGNSVDLSDITVNNLDEIDPTKLMSAAQGPVIQSIPRGFLRFTIFRESGTWVKGDFTTHVWVRSIGPGGGAGAAEANVPPAQSDSGGGGGGGTCDDWIDVTAVNSVVVIIGLGGDGGVVGGPSGQDGGITSFGTFCSASGGEGGSNGVSTSATVRAGGGAGGVSGSGIRVYPGGRGSEGTVINGIALRQHFGGGTRESTATSGDGSTINGNQYGGGAPGVSSFGAGVPGGRGDDGAVMIWEYALA